MADILKLHDAQCPIKDDQRRIQISLDGVAECRSNSVSIDVYSFKFKNCKNIYPHKLVRPLNKSLVDNRSHLSDVLNSYSENNMTIEQFVGDKLKRSEVKDCLGHSSNYPCEYCFAKGTRLAISGESKKKRKEHIAVQKRILIEKINALQNQPSTSDESETLQRLLEELNKEEKTLNRVRSQTVWPASTIHAELRTIEKIRIILRKISENEQLSKEERKGIVRESLFMNIPRFHFVYDMPAEYMHSLCLGVVKRLVELTFNVGEVRSRITKRKLSDVSVFNKLMLQIRVHFEFSRRSRELDFAVYKAEEFRNLVLFFFPIVIKCIDENEKEIKLWLLLAFSVRACCLPTQEFRRIPIERITFCCEQFYKLYEQLFGAKNCSYNTHVVFSHMIEIRYHGPLTLTSAFKFENFYGEMRHAFTPGTKSPLKQIMQKILLKRALSYHCCENSITLSNHDTERETNSLIYTFINNTYQIYKIAEIMNDSLVCFRQGKYAMNFKETPTLNWQQVGVFKRGPISNDTEIVLVKNVSGKVLEVDNLLITCPNNVLREK